MTVPPKLTIGIPTFNGERFIEGTLASVFSSLSSLPNGLVEVLVSDNASTDRTPSIVEGYQRRFPGVLQYHRNEVNLGYDRNVDMVFRKAQGDFVQLLGDDDYPCQVSSFQNLLEFLKTCQDEDVIHSGYRYFDLETAALFDGTHYTEDLRGLDGDSFFSQTRYVATTLSSLVFRQQAWLSIDVAPFIGSSWIQVGVMVMLLGRGARAAIFSEHLVVVRIANSRWAENFGNFADLKVRLFEIFCLMRKMPHSLVAFRKLRVDYYAENFHIFRAECRSPLSRKFHLARNGARFFWNSPGYWFVQIPALVLSDGVWKSLIRLRKTVARSIKSVLRWRAD